MKVKDNNPGNRLLLQLYTALLFVTSVLSSPIIIANSDLSSITPVIADSENNLGKRNVYIPVNSTSKYATTTMETVSMLPLGSMIDPETISKILAENEVNAPVNVSRHEAIFSTAAAAVAVRTMRSATYAQIIDTLPSVSKREVVATDRTIKSVADGDIMDTVSELPLGSSIDLTILSKLFVEMNNPADVSKRDNVSATSRTFQSTVSAEIMATLSKLPLGSTVDSDTMSKIAADIAADISMPQDPQERNTTSARSEAATRSDLDQVFYSLPLGSPVDPNTMDKLFSELVNLNASSGVSTDAPPTISSSIEDSYALVPRHSTYLLGVCGNRGSLCRKPDVSCTIDMKTGTVNCPTCQCTETGAASSSVCLPTLRLFSIITHLFLHYPNFSGKCMSQ